MLGHGTIHRDAIRFLPKSVFEWGMELPNWGASGTSGWTSIVERPIRQLDSYQLKSMYSTRVTCLFRAFGLLSMIYFCRSGRVVSTAKELSIYNDILIGLFKAPLHFSCSKRFIAHVEQIQGERHATFGEKARAELKKSAAKREGCVGLSPRFLLGLNLRTLRVCSRVYHDFPVEHHTQLICLWSAPGVWI